MKSRILMALAPIAFLCAIVSCKKDDQANDQLQPKTVSSTVQPLSVSTFTSQLAYRWAPVHYQDVDQTGTYALGGKSDYITATNFDNDWVATNNWNNIASSPANAVVYYSVVETSTHWFITYAFFHPRDWTDIFFLYQADQHENDLEGYTSIIKKDGSTYGAIQGIVTVSHSDFFSFVPSGSPLTGNQESVDGTLSFETYDGQSHPVTAQEAKGHGLKAHPYYNIVGDGIKYYPSATGVSEAPSNPDDRDVKYKLVNVFEANGMWDQRFNTQFFYDAGGGVISGMWDGHANAPWAWNDGNDGDVQGGEIATDPAKMFNIYFSNLGTFSTTYVVNWYKGIF